MAQGFFSNAAQSCRRWSRQLAPGQPILPCDKGNGDLPCMMQSMLGCNCSSARV